MKDPLFSGPAQVEIQGPCVLEFVSLDEKQAVFDVIGFQNPKVRVVDIRPNIQHAMSEILQIGDVKKFANDFNTPARVTILPSKRGKVTVYLEPTRAKEPRHMLWVAIGIGKNIPYYDYKLVEIQEWKRGKYALLVLYKRPRP